MFERPLICTDLCDGLDRLASLTASLAAGGARQVTFLCAVPYEIDREIPHENKESLENARRVLAPALTAVEGLETVVEVRSGRPEDLILAAATEHQCDAIFVGGASHSLLEERLFGSTSIDLCKHSTLPLFIIRPQLLNALTVEEMDLRCRHLVRGLLVPHNGGVSADRVTAYLLAAIRRQREQQQPPSIERCFFYQAVTDYSARNIPVDYVLQENRDRLDGICKTFEAEGIKTEALVETGSFLTGLLNAAQEYDVSAIAIASRHRTFLLDWSVPDSGQRVLRRSLHPVLFLPPKASA